MHTFRAMNSLFFTDGLPAPAQTRSEQWIAGVERKLSRFDPESELSSLNRSGGQVFIASPLLYRAIAEADSYYRLTNGLFNPYLGKMIQQLGYSTSFEHVEQAALSIDPPPSVVTYSTWSDDRKPADLLPGIKGIILDTDVSVDLGGFAKGWSAHRLLKLLQKEGISKGAVGAGGDISLWGTPKEGWQIGVGDPWDDRKDALTLTLYGSAVQESQPAAP
jgi:thiamine biosynthesis lipoprotein